MIHPPNSLRERTRGRWFAILTMLGVDGRCLRNRHGPCPACGGTDRFRWDDKNGDGTFYCNQCGAGSGIDLVMRVRGLSIRGAALLIEAVIFDARSFSLGREPPRSRPQRSEAAIAGALNALWRSGNPVRTGDPVDLWFRHRGITLPVHPTSLRTAMRLRHGGPPVTFHPAMLARVTDPTGSPVTIHRTWLTATGAKAPVDPVRMFCPGKVPPGSAVRLASAGPILAVAEGIETALAAQRLFGFPVWACLTAGRLKTFEPAVGTKRLIICGDNDADGTGQRAAYALASRLQGRLPLEVRIPDQPDTDWNDVLRLTQK
jgi:putative DNA primase/helicase